LKDGSELAEVTFSDGEHHVFGSSGWPSIVC